MHGTGQTASPSCAISYTINYIDRYGTEALIDYWNKVVLTPALRENILKNGRVQLYMDSLELTTFSNGGQFWGYDFLAEFKARRGYDLAPHLPLVFKKAGMMMLATAEYRYACDDIDFWAAAQKRPLPDHDRHVHGERPETHSDVAPFCGYDRARRDFLRPAPLRFPSPGKYVDGVETESLEFASQIDSYRGLAGTAHIYNRLFSSETGATLANYKKPIDFYTQIIYTQFAAGCGAHGAPRLCIHLRLRKGDPVARSRGHVAHLLRARFGVRQPAFPTL